MPWRQMGISRMGVTGAGGGGAYIRLGSCILPRTVLASEQQSRSLLETRFSALTPTCGIRSHLLAKGPGNHRHSKVQAALF